MFKKTTSILFLLLGLSLTVHSQVLSDEVVESIKYRVDNGVNVGIVVGVVDAKGTHFYSYGFKSLETKEDVDKNSIFEIGSISKTFTGILLANNVLHGKMNLDDKLQQHLPEGITAPTRNGREIRLFEMSNHTSSLPRMPTNFTPADLTNPYVDYSEEQLFEFLESVELTRDIGSQFEYSNYAVGLLGHLMALKNKTSYEELMVSTIAKPLGMKNTRIVFTPEMNKQLAMGHNGKNQVSNWDLVTMAGAGAIRSDAVDMLKYLSANMGKMKSDLYPAMQMAHKNTREEGAEQEIGLGWITMKPNDVEIVWHNGGTGGYRAFAGFLKDGTKGVVVLTNSTSGIDDIGIHLLNPKSPLTSIKIPISTVLKDLIDSKGIVVAVDSYRKLKTEQADKYNFAVGELNALGYQYLNSDKIAIAMELFKLNLEAYPEDSNAYDSMGESYMKNGENEKAIVNYKKSVELDPGNTGGIEMLKKLGVEVDTLKKEIVVATAVLDTYVGDYELAPSFIVTITRNENQLEAQATNQPKFPVFPKSENVFYFKVVQAQLTFNKGENGKVISLTLDQNGQQVPGKKIN